MHPVLPVITNNRISFFCRTALYLPACFNPIFMIHLTTVRHLHGFSHLGYELSLGMELSLQHMRPVPGESEAGLQSHMSVLT